MKILLFDDHPLVLEGLRNCFLKKEGVEIVGAACTKEEALELLASQPIDIFISDVLTDEELGLTLFEEIQARNFEARVVVYSKLNSELIHHFLFEYGVVAIVNKAQDFDELWQVVELVYLTARYKKKSDYSPPPVLTPKEKEIVKYLAWGMAAKEIATLTQSSVNTINNQKNHLLAKFACLNGAELLVKLTQMGYVKM